MLLTVYLRSRSYRPSCLLLKSIFQETTLNKRIENHERKLLNRYINIWMYFTTFFAYFLLLMIIVFGCQLYRQLFYWNLLIKNWSIFVFWIETSFIFGVEQHFFQNLKSKSIFSMENNSHKKVSSNQTNNGLSRRTVNGHQKWLDRILDESWTASKGNYLTTEWLILRGSF